VYNNSTNFIDPSGNIPIAFLVPVAVKALTTIVGGVSFLLSLQPSQNQKNSVSPFIVHLLIALSVNSHPI
jgi:hypothetical protein